MKLSPWAWLVMGAAISLIVLSYAYFHVYRYNMEEAGYLEQHAVKLQTEADKQKRAEQRLAEAQADVAAKDKEWQNVVAVKTPPASVAAGGVNVAVNPYQLTVDSRKFRDSIQRDVNFQVKRGGVNVISGPEVSYPSEDPSAIMAGYYNYPAVSYPVCVFELGQVEVEGTYGQISQNIRSWSSMPNYMAVASGLAITGTAPKLRATYNVVLVAYIRGDKIPPALPGGAPGATTAPGPSGQAPAGPGGGGGRSRAGRGSRGPTPGG